jgi:hypothetical protein
MVDQRVAWADFYAMQVIVFEGDDTGQTEADGGDIVTLRFRTPGSNRQYQIPLSGLTEGELDAFKKVIDIAIEKARPRCIQLDNHAKEQLENGNDTLARLYRALPKVFERSRRQQEHSPGVLHGSETPTGNPPGNGANGAGDLGVLDEPEGDVESGDGQP